MTTIPAEYGYTLAVGFASTFLVQVLAQRVGAYRKVAGVALPKMYVDEEEAKKDKKKQIFNCKQRVHQNTLEGFASYMFTLLVAGINYPRAAPALGLIWCLGRIAFSYGYSTGDPNKRMYGAFGFIGTFGLLGLSAKVAYEVIQSA
ncbi:Microsomal glutathione S-transferase 3 [Entomortierella beljakovae]|nr:Microsomal glutathione S-transferase 3 [Entomortierella beljakovae]